MTLDHTEELITEAFAAEADRAVDARVVHAALARGRRQRRIGPALLTATVAVVVVAIGAVVVPSVLHRGTPAGLGGPPPEDQNVLIAGKDSNGELDTVILGHLDADGTATAMTVPGDVIVLTSDGSETPLNQIVKLSEVVNESGMRSLATEVRKLTGLTFDHYAEVDMSGFAELADAIGGVPACLRHPSTDAATGVSFPAGRQVLRGKAALAFIRQRGGLPNGGLDRVARQEAFVRSLLVKAHDADPLKLLDIAHARVHTDPELDLVGLAEQLRNVRELRVTSLPNLQISGMSQGEGTAILALPTDAEFTTKLIAGNVKPLDMRGLAKPLPPGNVPCVN